MRKIIAILMVVSLMACKSPEKEAFDVVVTLPAQFCADVTQENLEKSVEAGDFHSAIWNEDGSLTYTMSSSQHARMMQAIKEAFEKRIESDEFSNFTKIDANDEMSQFTITTRCDELDLKESFSVVIFYTYGAIYNIFNGKEDFLIELEYVNAESGKVIYSTDSTKL